MWPWRRKTPYWTTCPLDEVTEAGIVARPVTPFADLGLYERQR